MSNRIEICGAIASGKTTLANAYTKLNSNVVFEDFSKISMLDDFYSDPPAFAFETEIAFTLQHYYQVKKTQSINTISVCDFSSVDDYAFALVSLNTREMEIYNQVYIYILEQIGKPQKLIRLSTSLDELISRISKRGRNNEQSIDKTYLMKFENGLAKAIELFYSDVPLIHINTEQVSFSDYNREFLEGLL
jgi:deoxyadenosine/deoxycytidine kinase